MARRLAIAGHQDVLRPGPGRPRQRRVGLVPQGGLGVGVADGRLQLDQDLGEDRVVRAPVEVGFQALTNLIP